MHTCVVLTVAASGTNPCALRCLNSPRAKVPFADTSQHTPGHACRPQPHSVHALAGIGPRTKAPHCALHEIGAVYGGRPVKLERRSSYETSGRARHSPKFECQFQPVPRLWKLNDSGATHAPDFLTTSAGSDRARRFFFFRGPASWQHKHRPHGALGEHGLSNQSDRPRAGLRDDIGSVCWLAIRLLATRQHLGRCGDFYTLARLQE